MSDDLDPIHGSCICGAVRYTIAPPFLGFQQCHCSRCRKSTGTAYAANIFVRSDRFSWDQGEEHVRCYKLPSARYWSHGFCDQCGSSLPWLSGTGKAFIVPAGNLDGDPGERPDKNIFWASRAAWYVHPDELDTFDERPPKKA